MKIALISDTHDHLEHVGQALEVFAEARAEVLIHAGDFVSPFTAQRIATFDGPIYAVYGNCDGDRANLSRFIPNITPSPAAFELAGKSFVLAHNQYSIPQGLIPQADVIVVGHTHLPQQTCLGQALLVNPGECCARVSGQATVALLDSDDLSVEVVTLP